MALSEQQEFEFQEAFNLFDTDHDGKLSLSELGVVMRSLGQAPSEHDLKEMLKSINSSSVSFDQFKDLMLRQMKNPENEEELREAFRVFDKEGKGFISSNELKHIMSTLGEVMSGPEIDRMIKIADVDGDGQINYDHFVKMMIEMGK